MGLQVGFDSHSDDFKATIDLLNAYRDEMAPTLGRAFIEGFIARNRSSMLRMLAPLVALMNERMQAPRVREARREDPDAVTPEKDAIVWAAFMDLVNQKRRQFGMQELEVTESMPRRQSSTMRASLATMEPDVTESTPTRHPRGGPIAITLRHPRRRDLIAMVTASASEPGRYQLTWADDEGPSGHTTRDTAEEAVRYALEEGYRLDTANTSKAREMVERVQQERERRAAEIESWLTESLPSRGTCGRTDKERRQAEHIAESYESRGVDPQTSKSRACSTVNARRNEMMEPLPLPRSMGRMGDGFTVGEHVIRIGDMIKMEGQLGGYVVGVDRDLGIARIEQDNECGDGWDAKFMMPQPIEMPAPPRQTGMGETTSGRCPYSGLLPRCQTPASSAASGPKR